MKILVTGASGFVGASFLRIAPSNWDIYCIGRKNVENANHFIKADFTNINQLKRAAVLLKDIHFDALVHLAALVPRNAEEDELGPMVDVNIKGTANLLEAFQGKITKIIYGSTAEVYSHQDNSGLISEDSIVGPGSYYASTKLGGEYLVSTYANKNVITATMLRFSVMYGGEDRINRALPNFINKALNNETIHINKPDTQRDYVHVDDVVISIIKAIESEGCGIVPIGTGKVTSIYDAAQQVVAMSGSSSKIVIDEPGKGHDIIMDTSTAMEKLGFNASIIFPDRLEEMIALYE